MEFGSSGIMNFLISDITTFTKIINFVHLMENLSKSWSINENPTRFYRPAPQAPSHLGNMEFGSSEIANFLIAEIPTFTKVDETRKTNFTLFTHFSVRPYF